MAAGKRFPQEVRERAVRMAFDHPEEYASQWEALRSISAKIGCSAETLGTWVRQAEVDSGRRGDLTSDERARKALGWRTPAEALDELLRSLKPSRVATTT